MESQKHSTGQWMAAEGRCPLDTPLSENELEVFDRFYREFLNKKMEDKLSLLKGLSIMRRGDLRSYVQYAIMFQKRYENLIPLKQRDLLLSFPSVNKEVYNLIFSCLQNYGTAGETVIYLTRDQVSDHLDRTEMFRLDLDSLMSSAPAIIPENKEALEEYFQESSPSNQTYKFAIIILADSAFLSVLPGTERNSTIAIGQVRSYLEKTFKERFEENLIEFFVVGGGYIRCENGCILIGGRSLMFDPLFAEVAKPLSDRYCGQFIDLKFQLAQQILKAEFPKREVIINRSGTGHLSLK
jgi:hypothetical protein